MVRRAIARVAPEPPVPLPGMNDAGVPSELQKVLNNNYSNASQEYGNSFAAHHPILSNIAAAGIGGLLMGPGGVLLGPLANTMHEQNRKNAVVSAYNNAIKSGLENQKSLDTMTGPRNYLQALQDQKQSADRFNIEQAKRNDTVFNTAPDLYPQSLNNGGHQNIPFMDRESANALFKQAMGASDIQAQMGMLRNAAQQGINAGYPVAPQNNGSGPVLHASASQQDYNLPPVIADPQTLLNNTQKSFDQGMQTGQKNYEFDQQAPDRAATISKTLQEVQHLIQQGKTEQAHQRVLQLQAQWYPKLTQSQINQNNRGPLPQLPTNTTELLRMYNAGGFGTPGTAEAVKNYTSALSRDPNGFATQTTFTRDEKGRVVGTTSNRVPIKAGINPQFQSTPTQAPTVLKGEHGVYHF